MIYDKTHVSETKIDGTKNVPFIIKKNFGFDVVLRYQARWLESMAMSDKSGSGMNLGAKSELNSE